MLCWETKYVLLQWLSIVVIVPFDLITIDSSILNWKLDEKDNKENKNK